MFSAETIYTCNAVNFSVAVGPITLLRILQEDSYRVNAYVLDLKHSVSCLNIYVWYHIHTLTMLYDQALTENGYTCDWSSCAVVMCVVRVPTLDFYKCNRPNLAITGGGKRSVTYQAYVEIHSY